ncbi:class I SAM-dependent methyltransferase [Cumulibacter manganitolerans]|uniref:class I SAM-dependent methyltransferase n=1 Tax=Cumulibacter manganitolerans TaxID=1884992 RepID=UPI001E5A4556|nr:class I SAM-dependent methyltransferase [Cumulibacter manganitolerans]
MGLRSSWEAHVLPRIMDRSLRDPITHPWREFACGQAHGEVLELGFAAGLNLRFYPAAVHRVLAIEPADLAWALAERRIDRARSARPALEVARIGLDGARVDLPDRSVDAVVSTWTMCSIPDLTSALAEVRRLLRPGGELRFAEHGLSPDADVARRQRRYQRWWTPVAGGCHLTRDFPALLDAAGFDVDIAHREYAMPGNLSRPWSWMLRGTATPR